MSTKSSRWFARPRVSLASRLVAPGALILAASFVPRVARAEPTEGHVAQAATVEPPRGSTAGARTPSKASTESGTRKALEARANRATFDGWRFAAEILAGAALGGAAGFGTYALLCDPDLGKECSVEVPLAAFGANLVGVTAGVYATGTLLGGEAGLGWTLVGVTTAFAGCGSVDPATCIGMGVLLAPVTGALVFELDSHFAAKSLEQRVARGSAMPFVVPAPGGVLGGMRGTF